MSESELLTAALAYAARGWHVFPLRPGDKRPAAPDHAADRCTGSDPRCAAAGRHVTWEERATTNPDRITRAWSARPYGIGIACGPSGLVVVDLDTPKPGATPPTEWQKLGITCGADVFADLAARHGFDPWPDTFTAGTPSGGTHLYYTHPSGTDWDGTRLGNTAGTLGWCVDTRAHGGYIAAPPTTTADGTYRILADTTPVALPGWLAHTLRPAPRTPVTSGPVRLRPAGPGAGREGDRVVAYLGVVLRSQCDRVAAATEGERNRALYLSALILAELAAGNPTQEWLPEATERELASVGLAVGLPSREIAATLRSGARAGARRPRPVVLPADAA
jgi:hypothetical protein